jgi:hypothetical protein
MFIYDEQQSVAVKWKELSGFVVVFTPFKKTLARVSNVNKNEKLILLPLPTMSIL